MAQARVRDVDQKAHGRIDCAGRRECVYCEVSVDPKQWIDHHLDEWHQRHEDEAIGSWAYHMEKMRAGIAKCDAILARFIRDEKTGRYIGVREA